MVDRSATSLLIRLNSQEASRLDLHHLSTVDVLVRLEIWEFQLKVLHASIAIAQCCKSRRCFLLCGQRKRIRCQLDQTRAGSVSNTLRFHSTLSSKRGYLTCDIRWLQRNQTAKKQRMTGPGCMSKYKFAAVGHCR